LDDLYIKEKVLFARKQSTALRELERFEVTRSQRSMQATERLPHALRRKDAKAVAALLAKGADADEVGPSGRSAREMAEGVPNFV